MNAKAADNWKNSPGGQPSSLLESSAHKKFGWRLQATAHFSMRLGVARRFELCSSFRANFCITQIDICGPCFFDLFDHRFEHRDVSGQAVWR
jgi:hypothetical protein